MNCFIFKTGSGYIGESVYYGILRILITSYSPVFSILFYSFRILSVLSDFHNPARTNRFLAGYFLIERGNPAKHTWNRGTAINGMVVLDGIKRLVSLVLIVMSST